MICKIAGLGVEVPEIGDLPERCKTYLSNVSVDITLDAAKMHPDAIEHLSPNENYYLISGFQFYRKLLQFEGMMLHSSAVVVNGYAYLFSGPCGIGKSTHANMYTKRFSEAVIINDDKPALRREAGKWMVYGTPWCGKNGINSNASAPLAGTCFLHRGDTRLCRTNSVEAFSRILQQTNGRRNTNDAKILMNLIDMLVREIPIFDFYNHAEEGDELITYNAILNAINGKDRI